MSFASEVAATRQCQSPASDGREPHIALQIGDSVRVDGGASLTTRRASVDQCEHRCKRRQAAMTDSTEKMIPGVNCMPEDVPQNAEKPEGGASVEASGGEAPAATGNDAAEDQTVSAKTLTPEEISELQGELRQLRSDLNVAKYTIEQLETENKAMTFVSRLVPLKRPHQPPTR